MTATLDVQRLVLADNPPGWPALPQPLRDALRAGGGTLWHGRACVAALRGPHDIRYACAPDCPVRLMQQVLARRWFLIENDAVPGYRPECGRCGQKHRYLTLMCVEKPFNGLTSIIAKLRDVRVEGNDRIAEGFRLGKLVPIKAAEALVLRQKIRDRGGRP